MSEKKQKPRLTFEELFETLLDREELDYQLDADNPPYLYDGDCEFAAHQPMSAVQPGAHDAR